MWARAVIYTVVDVVEPEIEKKKTVGVLVADGMNQKLCKGGAPRLTQLLPFLNNLLLSCKPRQRWGRGGGGHRSIMCGLYPLVGVSLAPPMEYVDAASEQ